MISKNERGRVGDVFLRLIQTSGGALLLTAVLTTRRCSSALPIIKIPVTGVPSELP
jgi:hypothetical protein